MHGQFAERDLLERLHLPPVYADDEDEPSSGPRHGAVFAVVALLFAVVLAAAWSRHATTSTWVWLMLTWIGAGQLIGGLALLLRTRR